MSLGDSPCLYEKTRGQLWGCLGCRQLQGPGFRDAVWSSQNLGSIQHAVGPVWGIQPERKALSQGL